MSLSYVVEKLEKASFSEVPFRHIEIDNFFDTGDLEDILLSPEIAIAAKDDADLFENLFANNYRVIGFPGCTRDFREYIKWHKSKQTSHLANTSCEGYGVVLRLYQPVSPAIIALQALLDSPEFIGCLAKKFDIDPAECNYDAGIQKYLDGYEISPHPDIRKKALTYMVNINPSASASEDDHHTSYLRFRSERQYVGEYWSGNPGIDRCWVPWSWCNPVKQQRQNNSIVIFSPGNDTLHGVKANYNHLANQRTQLYGNLWFESCEPRETPRWEDFEIEPTASRSSTMQAVGRSAIASVKRLLPSSVASALNLGSAKSEKTHGRRNHGQ